MPEEAIQTRRDGVLLYITLNRAAKRNALTLEMLEAIAAAVQAADQQPDLRAIILNAEGPVFSAGLDLPAFSALRAEAGDQHPARWLRRMAGRMQQCLNDIEATELPVIAAIQGHAIGLGLELALACDLRVAARDVQLSIPETRMGLVADVGGTTRLSRLVGPGRAKDMLLTARALDAEEAMHWGLVNRVADAPDFQDAAVALADSIARNAPLAVGLAKRIIDQGDGLDKHTQMALERWAQSELISTHDLGEALTAFLEKRPPKFQGR